MTVRPRTDADIGACLDLVRLVHATDGYPHHLPADLRAFLVSRDACAAWVAEHEGRVTDLHPAIRLYERCGWTRAGRVGVRFRNGITLEEYVYLGPRPAALSWFPSAP